MPESSENRPSSADRPRVLDQRLIHPGRSYDFVDLTVAHPDGKERTQPIVRHRGAATILPLLDTPKGVRIVMVRNERVTIDGSLLELPAGGIDEGEEPIATAGRELAEETGFRAAELEPLCQFYTTPGLTDEFMHVFVARDLSAVGQNFEPYESLTVELLPHRKALAMVASGEILDGKTVLALLMARSKGIISDRPEHP